MIKEQSAKEAEMIKQKMSEEPLRDESSNQEQAHATFEAKEEESPESQKQENVKKDGDTFGKT